METLRDPKFGNKMEMSGSWSMIGAAFRWMTGGNRFTFLEWLLYL